MNKLLLIFLVVLTACENVSKTEHTTEGNALEETIVRRKKRVIRYDCEGKITSDKIETINSVSKIFTIKPKISKDLEAFDAKNVTTNSKGGHISLLRDGAFTLDLAPTVFNIRAYEGMNEISWSFKYCKKNDKDECIETPVVKESGTLFIHIRQEVVNLEGTDEIKCQ